MYLKNIKLKRINVCLIAIVDKSTSIPWNDLEIHNKLGEGASGDVYRGTWKKSITTNEVVTVEVAVKLYKSDTTSDGRPEDEMNVILLLLNIINLAMYIYCDIIIIIEYY